MSSPGSRYGSERLFQVMSFREQDAGAPDLAKAQSSVSAALFTAGRDSVSSSIPAAPATTGVAEDQDIFQKHILLPHTSHTGKQVMTMDTVTYRLDPSGRGSPRIRVVRNAGRPDQDPVYGKRAAGVTSQFRAGAPILCTDTQVFQTGSSDKPISGDAFHNPAFVLNMVPHILVSGSCRQRK